MATRSNILITMLDQPKGTRVWIYRHWDGYPAVTGGDLLQQLIATQPKHHASYMWPHYFATALLTSKRDEAPDSPNNDQPQYELTNAEHGDIEHLYVFSFHADEPEIHHISRHDWGTPLFGHVTEYSALTIPEFTDVVNKDRRDLNDTIRKAKEMNHKLYADVITYPMMEVPA